MLNQHVIFEHSDLDAVELRPHNHHPVDTFAAREKFTLGDYGPTPTSVAAVTATLLFGLESGGTLDASGFVTDDGLGAWLADTHDRVGCLITGACLVTGATTRAPPDRTGVVGVIVVILIAAVAWATAVALVAAVVVVATLAPVAFAARRTLRHRGKVRGLKQQRCAGASPGRGDRSRFDRLTGDADGGCGIHRLRLRLGAGWVALLGRRLQWCVLRLGRQSFTLVRRCLWGVSQRSFNGGRGSSRGVPSCLSTTE